MVYLDTLDLKSISLFSRLAEPSAIHLIICRLLSDANFEILKYVGSPCVGDLVIANYHLSSNGFGYDP